MVDADSLLDPGALLNVARPFADDPGRVVAAGGVVRVANGSRVERGRVTEVRMPRTWLARIQVVEYLRAFLIGRSGWSRLGGLLIISGAFGIFRKDVLTQVGGMSTDCIGEDAELVVRIHRQLSEAGFDYDVVFVPEPVAWTEVPQTLSVLRRQRRRWHRGLTEIYYRHWRMVGRRKYGVIGMITMPWFTLFELLAPIVEVSGFLYFLLLVGSLVFEQWIFPGMNLVDPPIVIVMLSASVIFAVFVALLTLLAEEISFRRYSGLPDLFQAIWAAVEENVGYRQINGFWRLEGIIQTVRKARHDWGNMERRGFTEE
jgi:cellulose synthase/poly-beta-1,6-N-acetylglucosamine synthase-like glycosyltransferase